MMMKCAQATLLAGLVLVAGCGKEDSGGGGGTTGGGGGSSSSSGPDLSTPQGALKQLQSAFAAMDGAKLKACYTEASWKEGNMDKEFEELKGAMSTVEISWNDADIVVEGDKAKVKGKMKFKMKDGKEEDEGESFYLVKVDGKWMTTSK